MLCRVTGIDMRRHVFALSLVLVHAGSNGPHGALAECLTLYRIHWVFRGFTGALQHGVLAHPLLFS